jgi:hypothetical protein
LIVIAALEAPAIIAGLDDVAVVGQAVEQRGGHFGVTEDATGRIIAAHSSDAVVSEFLGFMNSLVATFQDRELHVILDNLNTYKKNERWLKKTSQSPFPFHSDPVVMAQSGRNMFFDPARSLNGASFIAVAQLQHHIDAFISIQRDSRAIRLDQEKGLHHFTASPVPRGSGGRPIRLGSVPAVALRQLKRETSPLPRSSSGHGVHREASLAAKAEASVFL